MSELLIPVINSASMSPNPVNINSSLFISVIISETTIEITYITVYCGTFYCGEDGDV